MLERVCFYQLYSFLSLTASSDEKPSINKAKSPEVVEASLGRSAVLLCFYGGKPAPKISWSKDGKAVPEKCEHCTTHVSHSTPGVSRLRVTPFREEDFGSYTCKARNSVGFDQIKIKLHQEDKGSEHGGFCLSLRVMMGATVKSRRTTPLR